MEELEKSIGHVFKDRVVLETALTHSSYANENRRGGAECNERLEFLGDAVLGFITARYLYGRFPEMPEGGMTKLRAELVCEKSLDVVAGKLGLGAFLRLGRGEEQSGGRTRPSIIADAVEAVLAAVYLDGGMAAAEKFVRDFILNDFEAGEGAGDRDCKTELQEITQRGGESSPEYRVLSESGPDHAKVFTVEVLVGGKKLAEGVGRSKKDAEQDAARAALEGMK